MGYRKYNNDSDVFIKPRIHDNGNWPAHRVAVFQGLHCGEHCEPTQELSVWEQLLLSMVTVKTRPPGCNHVPAVTGPPCSAGACTLLWERPSCSPYANSLTGPA